MSLGAVSINSSGGTQINGFTGGSITVGSNTYTEATVLKYAKDSNFTATATTTGNYQFKGWFDNADCSGTPLSAGTLSATLSENKTYYAKFVEQSNVTITFDSTSTTWVSNGDSNGNARLFIYDTKTANTYEMSNNDNIWTASVPVSVTSITFYRCTSSGFNTGNTSDGTATYWNKWSAGSRGTKTTYKTTGDSSGIWQ